jgi:hypothetical protein
MLVLAFILMRFLLAWVFKEKNDGWKYYLGLLAVSPFIVSGLYWIAESGLDSDMFTHAH